MALRWLGRRRGVIGRRRRQARSRRSAPYRTGRSRRSGGRRRRGIGRRALARMMSKRKYDTMVSRANPVANPDPSGTLTGSSATIYPAATNATYGNVHVFLFQPTGRSLVPNNAYFVSARTASNPFVTGISERYHLIPNDGSLWEHRRVVFAMKDIQDLTIIAGIASQFRAQTDAGGITYRKLVDLSGQSSGDYTGVLTSLYDYAFRGIYSTDWQDPMTAPVDRRRLTILADNRCTVRSGNAAPAPKLKKYWTPINKTVVYDDEENGTSITPSYYSVTSKPGLGDIYVMDLFTCRAPIVSGTTASSSTLNISSTQSLYWREK